MYNHKDKLHVAKTCFSLEAHIQITIATCNEQSEVNTLSAMPGRSTETHCKNNSMVLKNQGPKTLSVLKFPHKHSEFSHGSIPGPCPTGWCSGMRCCCGEHDYAVLRLLETVCGRNVQDFGTLLQRCLECRKQNLVGHFHGIRKSRTPREMWQWRPSARGFWSKDSILPMSWESDRQKLKSDWLMFLVGKHSKPACSHAVSWVLSAALVWIVS